MDCVFRLDIHVLVGVRCNVRRPHARIVIVRCDDDPAHDLGQLDLSEVRSAELRLHVKPDCLQNRETGLDSFAQDKLGRAGRKQYGAAAQLA